MIATGAVAALCFAGLISLVFLNSGKYNEYGEIDIPGSGVVNLPEGKVIVSFHVTSSRDGTSVPPLHLDIEPPPGGRDPHVIDDLGGSVTVNNDVHRQVWVMQVPAAGRYPVSVDGPVADYNSPKLAFGGDRGTDGWVWVLVAASMISSDLAIAAWWFQRSRRRRAGSDAAPAVPAVTADPYTPTDEGVRLEQLKNIAALRDSGALTESEFQAEKRRILEGQ